MLQSELQHLEEVIDIPLKVEDNVFNYLVQKGYTRDLGARMMRKTIEKEIGKALVSWKMDSKPSTVTKALNIQIYNQSLKAA